MQDDDSEQELWNVPLGLAELGALTARWLEGAIRGPWNGDEPPDPETIALVPTLAAVNRGGYVTDFSQPGETYDSGAQRAAVTGFCTFAQADVLAAVSLRSELIVIVDPPYVRGEYELPITQDEWRAFTRLAGRGVFDDPNALWPGCHLQTWKLLQESYYVSICDPQWGRDDLLWPLIVDALESEAPPRGGLITTDEE